MNKDCPSGHYHCAAEQHLVSQETPRYSKHFHVSSSSYNSAPLTMSSLLICSRLQVHKVSVVFSKASPQPLLFLCLSCPLSKRLTSLNFTVHKYSNTTALCTDKSGTTWTTQQGKVEETQDKTVFRLLLLLSACAVKGAFRIFTIAQPP